ncbi:XRE family transcriptional regulator [Gordonia sp. CPCC 205515]|uniref:helix-turn-helix domain-containing protein n=1 Tax=Gordonia sp. CPCC 205515 TaxID=3140791 RepID=UPI003AF38EEC
MSTSEWKPSDSDRLTPERIQLARMRRGLTKAQLARAIGVTPRSITTYETDGAPVASAGALAEALEFPVAYFTRPDPADVSTADVNFRAARRAAAREKHAAVAAGVAGIEIDHWISERFKLPPVDLPTFVGEKPRTAARLLRAVWGLGTKPLPNLVQLAESRGIRVYSLPPMADAVDAYSIRRNEIPYVFLARRKSPERTRFDLAHEIGHLILHADESPDLVSEQEREADDFASEFLMPAATIVEYLPQNPSVHDLLEARSLLKVSAMALAFAAHKVGRMSDWAYRQTCIQLSQRGYRTGEPGGMSQHEISRVFPQILGRYSESSAWTIARDLDLPVSDVHDLTFGAELRAAHTTNAASIAHTGEPDEFRPVLRLVHDA